MFQVSPAHTKPTPEMTTTVLHTSVEKCSASASNAWLENFFATRDKARARVTSIASANNRMTMAVTLGAMWTLRKNSLVNASQMMYTAVNSRRPVSMDAEKFSHVP